VSKDWTDEYAEAIVHEWEIRVPVALPTEARILLVDTIAEAIEDLHGEDCEVVPEKHRREGVHRRKP